MIINKVMNKKPKIKICGWAVFNTIFHHEILNRGLSPLAYNVWCFAKVGISRHKSSIYPHSLIVVQMFNKPLLPHFCKARVICRCGYSAET
jgi:hypothetical protein